MAETSNRFENATNAEELINQVVGAASMCWEDVARAGVFDSTEAEKVAREGLDRLGALIQAAFDAAISEGT